MLQYIGQGTIVAENIIVLIVGLIILWAIVSIPVWIAAKVVTVGKATFGEAMVATLAGPIVYFIVFLGVELFLGAVVGGGALTWAYILAFIAWIWAYKSSFATGWLQGIAIAFLAVIVFGLLSVLLGMLFGAMLPSGFFPTI